MDLAAFGLLLGLDLVERELEGVGGSWRVLEDASQDSSSENSINAGLGSTEKQVAVAIFLR